jgi:hypothetical protein
MGQADDPKTVGAIYRDRALLMLLLSGMRADSGQRAR